jgi:hypothetical protein
VAVNQRLERDLQRGLRAVAAPPELWDRLQSVRVNPAQENNRGLVWALALAVVLAAVGLSLVRSPARQAAQQMALHCQNPAQLRSWVRANTGLDVPLRAAPPASIQLIGARNLGGSVEIAYRAANRAAVLSVSKAEAESPNAPHGRVSGNVSSWIMAGQRFRLASDSPADLLLACKLCHLD